MTYTTGITSQHHFETKRQMTHSGLSITLLILGVFVYYLEPYMLRQVVLLLLLAVALLGMVNAKTNFGGNATFGFIIAATLVPGHLREVIINEKSIISILIDYSILAIVAISMSQVSETIRPTAMKRNLKLIHHLQYVLLGLAVMSLFFNISGFLGQTIRPGPDGLLGFLRRANGPYTEPGMLSNTAVTLWVISISLGAKSKSLYALPILICILSSAVVGLIFTLIMSLHWLNTKGSGHEPSVFSFIKPRRLLMLLIVIVLATPHIYHNILLPRMAKVVQFQNSADQSAILKVTNVINVINQDSFSLLVGSGSYANERVTFDKRHSDGTANISDGFAFVNSSGFLVLYLFEYGLISVLILVSAIFRVKFPLHIAALILTRFGDASIFIATLAFVIGRSKLARRQIFKDQDHIS